MRSTSLVVALATMVWSSSAQARSFRVNQVPNGGQFGCALCHNNAQGGGPRNGFGGQIENTLDEPKTTADVDWSIVFDKDGDADGYSNGLELGDPEGTWTIGDPDPEGDIYGPHDRTDSPCGDGELLNPPEECDSDDLNGMTCEDLGWGPGTLSCNSACRFNESECEGWEPPNAATGNNQATNGATNGATNQNTNGQTGDQTSGQTTNEPTVDLEDEPSGCCATVDGRRTATPLFALLAALFVFARRRRIA